MIGPWMFAPRTSRSSDVRVNRRDMRMRSTATAFSSWLGGPSSHLSPITRRRRRGGPASNNGGRRILQTQNRRERGRDERPLYPAIGEPIAIGSAEEEMLSCFQSTEAIPIPIHIAPPQSQSQSPSPHPSSPSTRFRPWGRSARNEINEDGDGDTDDDDQEGNPPAPSAARGFFRFRRLRGGSRQSNEQEHENAQSGTNYWPAWLRNFWRKKDVSRSQAMLEDELSLSMENVRELPNAWAQAMRRRSSTDSLLAIARYVQEERESSSRRGSRRDSRESLERDDSLLSGSGGSSRKNSSVPMIEEDHVSRSDLLSSLVDFSRNLGMSRRSSSSSSRSTSLVIPVDSDRFLSSRSNTPPPS